MTPRIVGTWGELAATILIWGFYFLRLIQSAGSGYLAEAGFARAMGLHFGLSVAASILAAILIGFAVELFDKRDRRSRRNDAEAWAGLRATRLAHGVTVAALMILIGLGLALGAFAGLGTAERAGTMLAGLMDNGLVLAAHIGVLVLILAEIAHYGALITYLSAGRR